MELAVRPSGDILRRNPQQDYELIQRVGSGTYGDVYKKARFLVGMGKPSPAFWTPAMGFLRDCDVLLSGSNFVIYKPSRLTPNILQTMTCQENFKGE